MVIKTSWRETVLFDLAKKLHQNNFINHPAFQYTCFNCHEIGTEEAIFGERKKAANPLQVFPRDPILVSVCHVAFTKHVLHCTPCTVMDEI